MVDTPNDHMSSSLVDQLVDGAEIIGIVGSPSSTSELALDILGRAVDKKLVGELALFRFLQDGQSHYALGQITEITLRNIWHEDPTIRSLIRQRGRIGAVSERQDTHLGEMTVSAVFKACGNNYQPSILGTVPATGTSVALVEDAILDQLLSPYREQLFYLGRVYGSRPRLPLWFKHFGSGFGGAGEAYHIGIFGKTGSGKSVLAKMILLAYARHPEMGILIIDPQGEFSKEVRGEHVPGGFQLPVSQIINSLGKRAYAFDVRNLVLDTWELFEQILYESLFFEQLTIPKGENRQLAARTLADRLKKRRGVKLANLHSRDAFNIAWEILQNERVQEIFYRTKDPRQRFQNVIADTDEDSFYRDYWLPITRLFREEKETSRRTVEQALNWVFDQGSEQRPILVINLATDEVEGLLWNEKIQSLVIKRILDGIRRTAENAYREGLGLNTLVLIDEAHRLAPQHATEEEERVVRNILIDAARTTRKYGVGWVFISQTLSSLHREIVQQMRVFFFGFGLSMGSEYQSLRELAGGDSKALALYQLFRDPHSSFDVESREYSFMTIGPVSPLSFAGTPLFFNAFNSAEDFMSANDLRHHG